MRNTIRFLLGAREVVLDRLDPTMTVLDYLRGPARLVGTKEGCNEGDCGACTVVVARPAGDRLAYRAINACIQLLGTLDGCQLITVEHLREGEALHPVQQALVDHHGSQCGFCTPGFVMSIFAQAHAPHPRPAIGDALAGNLCRCTGYQPIVAAAEAVLARPLDDAFRRREVETLARLRALTDTRSVTIGDGERTFHAPASIEDLADLCQRHPEATLVAGSTDVGLWITKALRRLDRVVYLGRVAGLEAVTPTETGLVIGAGATHTDVMGPLAALHPDLGELWRRFASVQIRNVATLGGNIANGSPIGDAAPALIAAGASLRLRTGRAVRSLPLEEFFLAYGRQDRRPGEFLEAIVVPRPAPGVRLRAYKVSKRFDQDISAVLAALAVRLEGGRVGEARLAFGGMAATPKRARAAEAALTGRPLDRSAIGAAQAALAEDFTPIDDLRASAAYRLRVARNLLERFRIELTEPATQTRMAGESRLAHA